MFMYQEATSSLAKMQNPHLNFLDGMKGERRRREKKKIH